MRMLVLGLLLVGLSGCTVYSYYPVSPPPGHVHLHDGQGHCGACGLYFYEGAYFSAAPHGWVQIYGPAGPPYPKYHIHVHDGYGHCNECEWYFLYGRWYEYQPAGWFEFYYHN